MANDYSSPAVLPNPFEFGIGQDVLTAANAGTDTLRDTINQMLAHGQAGPLWFQPYPQTDFNHAGVSLGVAQEWRIPHITDSHSTITVGVTCNNAAGNAAFTFTSLNSAATAVINTGITAGFQTFTATLNIGSGVKTSEVTLEVSTGGSTVSVSEVFAYVDPLASPLAAGVIVGQWGTEDGVPLGTTTYGTADLPLSAARGRDMHQSLRHLEERPQCVTAWSGVDNVTSATASPHMQELIRRGIFTPASGGGGFRSPGGLPIVQVEFHVRAIEAAAGATTVYCQLGTGNVSQRWPLTIPGGAGAAAWHNLTLITSDLRMFREVAIPTMQFAIWPEQPGALSPRSGRTTAEVLSWTVIAR